MCSHHPVFGTEQNQILENGSCERAFTGDFTACHLMQYKLSSIELKKRSHKGVAKRDIQMTRNNLLDLSFYRCSSNFFQSRM